MNIKKYFLIVSIVLLLTGAVFLGIFAAKFAGNPFKEDTKGSQAIEKPVPVEGKIRFNVLILGLDKDESNTDVIMVVSFDEKKKAVSVLSIPRDTYVKFGKNQYLINSAYSMSVKEDDGTFHPGGVALTIKKVKELTGMPINHYFVFKVGTFAAVIDNLGGVEFDVPQRMKYSDPAQGLYIDLQAGLQKLNGDQAEGLVRFRSYPRADLQRVEVQQALLKELFKQKLSIQYLPNIATIYGDIVEKVISDLDLNDLSKYAQKFISASPDVKTYTMPTKLSGAHLLPSPEETDELIELEFGYDGPIKGNEPYTRPAPSEEPTDEPSQSE